MEQRNSKLISALAATTDPSQFADIVRQGAQMDLTCVKAVPDVLKALNINIPQLAINVNTDVGHTYWFGSPKNFLNEGSCVVDLILSNNHYQLLGGSTRYQIPRGQSGHNNCLYRALAEAIPKLLEVSAADFRQKLADCIESNPEIQQDIRSGRHQNLLQCGVFGGADVDDVDKLMLGSAVGTFGSVVLAGVELAVVAPTVVAGLPIIGIVGGVTCLTVAIGGAIAKLSK